MVQCGILTIESYRVHSDQELPVLTLTTPTYSVFWVEQAGSTLKIEQLERIEDSA